MAAFFIIIAVIVILLGYRTGRRQQARKAQAARARYLASPEYAAKQAAAQAEQERQHQEKLQALYKQWTVDISWYSQYGTDAVNQVMSNSLYQIFPLPAGQQHNWRAVWDLNERTPDGTLIFDWLHHSVSFTQAEIERQQHQQILDQQAAIANDAANQRMWNHIANQTFGIPVRKR